MSRDAARVAVMPETDLAARMVPEISVAVARRVCPMGPLADLRAHGEVGHTVLQPSGGVRPSLLSRAHSGVPVRPS